MCVHRHYEIGVIKESGYADKVCLDCGENLGEIPATYFALDKIYDLKLSIPKVPKENIYCYVKIPTENAYSNLKRRH